MRTKTTKLMFIALLGLLQGCDRGQAGDSGAITSGSNMDLSRGEEQCRSNLRKLDGAIQLWALEQRKNDRDRPTWAAIQPYLKDSRDMYCPLSSVDNRIRERSYSLGRVGENPKCLLSPVFHKLGVDADTLPPEEPNLEFLRQTSVKGVKPGDLRKKVDDMIREHKHTVLSRSEGLLAFRVGDSVVVEVIFRNGQVFEVSGQFKGGSRGSHELDYFKSELGEPQTRSKTSEGTSYSWRFTKVNRGITLVFGDSYSTRKLFLLE